MCHQIPTKYLVSLLNIQIKNDGGLNCGTLLYKRNETIIVKILCVITNLIFYEECISVAVPSKINNLINLPTPIPTF